MPTFGSLFAGIGGIDLGLERAGWTCRWQVEWDPFCQRVLAKHWPDVPRYGDITAIDWDGVERVDLLAGGFPCQPFSVAGQRRAQQDVRWLWPEFARAIRDLRPRLVLVENVPGLLGSHGGLGDVLGDLAALGYDAEWDCVPAAAVGAPHLRYRVWIVAHAIGRGLEASGAERDRDDASLRGRREHPRHVQAAAVASRGTLPDADADELRLQPAGLTRCVHPSVFGDDGPFRTLANSHGAGLEGWPVQPERASELPPRPGSLGDTDSSPANAHPSGRGPRRAASQPGWWSTEPDVGRVAHGVPSRVDRLRSLGNAVVPQVAEVIGHRLAEVMR